jgi:arylsulfatase A-like enzyme
MLEFIISYFEGSVKMSFLREQMSMPSQTNKPNIVYVMTDQMRATAMGCAGVEQVRTPTLDHFASEGTRFTRAISNSPACCPARATLWTGMHTSEHHVVSNDIQLRTDVKSFAQSLNDIGYKCGYIGKWHLDNNDRGIYVPPGPRRQGFDDYWAAYNCNHLYFDGYYYVDDNPEPVWIDGYEPMAQTRLAVEYILRKAGEEEPFFLVVSWGPPHDPYREVPQRYLDLYPEESLQLKANVGDKVNRKHISGYYAHMTALDECFADILEGIEDAGIRENTIVVFTSDHGDMLYSQNEIHKSKPWIESINIPLIMRWPSRIADGRVTDGPISIVDMMPTLLSLCGADIPDTVQGKDLSAYVLGDETAAQETVFINQPIVPDIFTHYEWRGVVTRTHTYASMRHKPWILYDDKRDPDQLRNLVDLPESEDLQASMERLMQHWLEKLNDPFENSDEVSAKYYKGSEHGIMPIFENETVSVTKRLRRQTRKQLLDAANPTNRT